MKEPNQAEISKLESQQSKNPDFKVAVICGSLRKNSTNAGLARAIYEARDPRFYFSWVNIIGFPVFNEDIESQGLPKDVETAR